MQECHRSSTTGPDREDLSLLDKLDVARPGLEINIFFFFLIFFFRMNENPDRFRYLRILSWRALLELVKQFQGKEKRKHLLMVKKLYI